MDKYNHQIIEKKWQDIWLTNKVFKAKDNPTNTKSYVLDMFPYPSAAGLHVGHPEGYTATDIYCRYLRHKGVDVLHPMGWDAFGLPAENYAIKTGVHPRELTWQNIDNFRRQIQSLGFSYDWDREINTAAPEYYRWTQWLFLQLYNKGLAYQKEAPVNWCNSCQTVLANEQVVGGECDRCHNLVEQRLMSQWFFKITDYADRLLKDLEGLDWPPAIIDMQKNWIGESKGAEVDFPLVNPQVKRFVILHGRSASAGLHFFPSLKARLEKMGYEVVTPDLPNTDMPDDVEQMEFVKNNIKLDEETVIVGHSMGGVVALRLLEQGIKVNKVILIATPFTGEFLDKKDRSSVTQACQKGFDFKTIISQAKSFVVLGDTGDYAVSPQEASLFAEKLNVKAKLIKANAGHFCSVNEPEVFAACTEAVKIFTTRLDTIFGATYLVLAPEHEAVNKLQSQITNWSEVQDYVKAAKKKTELERKIETKEKTGVKLEGVWAINPANNEKIPVYIADYVLTGYGTGAIMAVPAHDERDYEFAKKFNLPIKQVIAPETGIKKDNEERRDGGCGIIFDPQTQKYAVLENEQTGLLGFCAGGFDSTKDEQAELIREIEEESGLYDFSYIEKISTSFNHYYNSLKKVNRSAKSVCYLLILNSIKTKPTKHEDHEKFKLVWKDPSEVEQSFIDHKRQSDTEHWVLYLHQCVTRAVELGYDKTNTDYKSGAIDDQGILINSEEFNNLNSEEAIPKIAQKIGGQLKTQYRLRDWLISRQRYWGAPIPIIHCLSCGAVPVPDKDLPVVLPDDVDFRPTGESPLVRSEAFHKVNCPKCGAKARRESDTMDTFVDSSWYFLRYIDSQNQTEAFDKEKIKQWLPVDFYVGGAEHAVMHLLYARFFTKVLYDQGYVDFSEPFKKLRNQGLILGEDGQKMSKSRGNVVNPDEVVKEFGADSLRLFEMFLGPLEDSKPWSTSSIIGVRRFLEKIWSLTNELVAKKIKPVKSDNDHKEYNYQTAVVIKKVTNDIENFRFNTAISSLMEYTNYLQSLVNTEPDLAMDGLITLLILVNPFAPHLASEAWSMMSDKNLWAVAWPTWQDKDLEKSTLKIVVQVNGKLRANLEVAKQITESEIVELAKTHELVSKYIAAGYKKVIYVPGRLLNFVV